MNYWLEIKVHVVPLLMTPQNAIQCQQNDPMVSGSANISFTKYACLFHFCDKKLTDENNAHEHMVCVFNIALVQTKDLMHFIINAEAE